MLTANGRVDVLHLRMADVGSMAAAAVATRLGIPTVFTLAPDPHAVHPRAGHDRRAHPDQLRHGGRA